MGLWLMSLQSVFIYFSQIRALMHKQPEMDTSAALRQQHLSEVVTSVSPQSAALRAQPSICARLHGFCFTARWSPEGKKDKDYPGMNRRPCHKRGSLEDHN